MDLLIKGLPDNAVEHCLCAHAENGLFAFLLMSSLR